MIEAVGAKVICLSSYSPDFNPIELWWSQLKSFLRSFAPTTTEMVDKLISVALDLINPQHLRNWFASCLMRTHARSQMGTRAYSLNPFYRGSKVTVIGAISIKKVVALQHFRLL
ncbi:hypothetical protein N0Y54_14155 [Nostoc punctiforme UO1]